MMIVQHPCQCQENDLQGAALADTKNKAEASKDMALLTLVASSHETRGLHPQDEKL